MSRKIVNCIFKKIVSFLICFVLSLFTLAGCGASGYEYVTSFKTTNSSNAMSFEIYENTLKISGTVDDESKKFIIVLFDGDSESENKGKTSIQNSFFELEVQIPSKDEMTVDVYAGAEEYGQFESIIADFVNIGKYGDAWGFVMAPVYKENRELFSKNKTASEYLAATEYIQSSDSEIVSLSNEITQGLCDNYDKVQAIHDWVAENIFYDFDAFYNGDLNGVDAKSVLNSKKSVCAGYANLMAALIRCQGLPCRVQSGFALGIGEEQKWTSANKYKESNHAWNEVYVDERWIIIDATWDSNNEYKDGEYIKGDTIKQIYFDSTMEFFSFSHKLLEDQEIVQYE